MLVHVLRNVNFREQTRDTGEAQVLMERCMKLLESHVATRNAMGSPLEELTRFSGRIADDTAAGSFKCRGPVSSAVEGLVRLEAVRRGASSEWQFARLTVEVSSGDASAPSTRIVVSDGTGKLR